MTGQPPDDDGVSGGRTGSTYVTRRASWPRPGGMGLNRDRILGFTGLRGSAPTFFRPIRLTSRTEQSGALVWRICTGFALRGPWGAGIGWPQQPSQGLQQRPISGQPRQVGQLVGADPAQCVMRTGTDGFAAGQSRREDDQVQPTPDRDGPQVPGQLDVDVQFLPRLPDCRLLCGLTGLHTAAGELPATARSSRTDTTPDQDQPVPDDGDSRNSPAGRTWKARHAGERYAVAGSACRFWCPGLAKCRDRPATLAEVCRCSSLVVIEAPAMSARALLCCRGRARGVKSYRVRVTSARPQARHGAGLASTRTTKESTWLRAP